MATASRWASQAALDALLRFNPQQQALQEQIQEAKNAYTQTVGAGQETARQTQASVQRALPQLAQAYSAADIATKPGVSLVSQALAALPADAAQYRANQAASGATFLSNLAGARADAQRIMLERGTRAREGAQFNQQQARQTLTTMLGQLFAKGQSLAAERGLFSQSEQEKLQAEAEGRAVTERGQNLTSASARAGRAVTTRGQNLTQQTAREGREQKAREHQEDQAQKKWEHEHPSEPGKGGKPRSAAEERTITDQHNKARDTIEEIRHEAFGLRGMRHQYNEAKSILEAEIKTKALSRKGYPNNGLLKAGLDLAYFGGIGTGTAGLLHREGLNVGKLGYPIYHAPAPTAVGVRGATGPR